MLRAWTAFLLAAALPAYAGSADALRASYAAMKGELAGSGFGRPLHIESREDGSSQTGDIYAAIDRMMKYAHGVSAKSYDFGSDGAETTLDYARILKIVTDHGYHGHVGIEYEGGRLNEPEGIKATKALLDRLRGAEYTG